jgi:hypothetical protein
MNKVMQTQTGEMGNCMSACLATVFCLSIEDVPNFFDHSEGCNLKWWASLREWLRSLGYGVLTINADQSILDQMEGVLIVGGLSPRGVMHATVWKDGVMIHDPHPEGGGIEGPYEIDLLYPLNPSSLKMEISHDN